MNKYKFIGIIMVMIGNAILLSELLGKQSGKIVTVSPLYFGSAVVILLGAYILHLSNKRSII